MRLPSFGFLLVAVLGSSLFGQDLPKLSPLPVAVPTIEVTANPEVPFDEAVKAAAEKRWEKEINAIEKRDKLNPDPEDGILFIGSSSIRLWETIEEDIAPYLPIQRGYGGSNFSNVAVFAKRLIEPHQYKAMVVFVANDVTGRETDKTPEEVIELMDYVIEVSRKHQPDAPVFVIEITPTASRWKTWTEIRQVNAAIREYCLTTPNVHFIPTAEYYLDAEGNPIPESFRSDKLHLTRSGYKLWGRLIKQRLDDFLPTN